MAVAVLGLVFATTEVQAQVFTPSYMSPVMLNDLGIYISDGPGDVTLEGVWRGGPLGVRVGFVDADFDDFLSVGGEFRMPLTVAEVPVGLAFTAAGQALVGDETAIGLQGGVTAGYRFVQEGIALTPYIHPRLAFINGFGPNDDFDMEVLADVGVDVELPRNLVFRLGIGLSDENSDWGIGLAWRR